MLILIILCRCFPSSPHIRLWLEFCCTLYVLFLHILTHLTFRSITEHVILSGVLMIWPLLLLFFGAWGCSVKAQLMCIVCSISDWNVAAALINSVLTVQHFLKMTRDQNTLKIITGISTWDESLMLWRYLWSLNPTAAALGVNQILSFIFWFM